MRRRTVLLPLCVPLLLCACAQTDPTPERPPANSSEHARWIAVDPQGCLADIPFPRADETATWTGSCRNGRIDGPGMLRSSNGTRLEGSFSNGLPVDAAGRVSGVAPDGRRVALAAEFKNRSGAFSPWTKSDEDAAEYGRRIAVLIRRHILVPNAVRGHTVAVVELRTDPTGRVESVRLAQPSGRKAWDDAVVRACWRVGALPFDDDGTVPASFELSFRPR